VHVIHTLPLPRALEHYLSLRKDPPPSPASVTPLDAPHAWSWVSQKETDKRCSCRPPNQLEPYQSRNCRSCVLDKPATAAIRELFSASSYSQFGAGAGVQRGRSPHPPPPPPAGGGNPPRQLPTAATAAVTSPAGATATAASAFSPDFFLQYWRRCDPKHGDYCDNDNDGDDDRLLYDVTYHCSQHTGNQRQQGSPEPHLRKPPRTTSPPA
jgi:hypothetical protein